MLHTKTVAPRTLDLIKLLSRDPQFSEFRLVGGTALSLQIGHRISIDIDLFTERPFESIEIANHLKSTYKAENIKTLKNGVFCFIDDIKVDIMSHQYPWLNPPTDEEGIKMVSLSDIGAMKLHAIVQNGSRLKDFVDIYFLLEHIPLKSMLNSYEKKYPDANRTISLKALSYFDDIKPTTIDFFNREVNLSNIEDRLKKSALDQSKVFSQSELAASENKTLKRKRRGRGI